METTNRFMTALRNHVRLRLEQLGQADIVVGIPSYYSSGTIAHVIQAVAAGLSQYCGECRAVIMVSDGGSTDDSREVANLVQIPSFNIEKIVTIYRGIPGKGSGLRAVFEAANFLKAKAVAVFDSDLVSIKPEWIGNVLNLVREGYDFVAPFYRRYKLDGTITNTIAYNMTRALYGLRIRQPIGGDFGISGRLVKDFLDQDVWETDVARFGIDVWMTTSAIVWDCRICQARLGVKIHGHKDPAADLGPMFRQVVGSIFQMMEQHEGFWKNVADSKDVPILGAEFEQEPAPFEVDMESLIDYFRVGFRNFESLWERSIDDIDMRTVRSLAATERREDFRMPVETWARIIYRYAAAFQATPRQRFKVLDTMIPLYYARVVSLINELADASPEEAERQSEANAQVFERLKPYLLDVWKKETENG
ncbi:MAG TPA: glycosyltransferase [Syntrophales bacterium]|nr:glycosyltransferase [Syntrophales bacterium]